MTISSGGPSSRVPFGIDCFLPDIGVVNVLGDQFAWDVIYFNGTRVPGIAKVTIKRAHRTDKRTANGSDGTTLTSLGYDPAEVTIKIRLWTPQQFADFQAVTVPSVQPRPGKASARPLPFTVNYPSLAMWSITRLWALSIAGPEETSVPQEREVTFICSEHSPLVSVGTSTPKGPPISAVPTAQPTGSPSTRATGPTTGQP